MNMKYFAIVFALILLTLNVFAVAPVLSDINASTVYISDHNYANWKPNNNITLRTLVTGIDLNKDGCGYAINGTFTYPTAVDLNIDTNVLQYIVMTTTIDDINWGLSCTNTSGETGFKFRTIYLDANAPTLTSSLTTNNVTITASDKATNKGNGSGIKRIYYKLDNAAWTYSTSNPLTITPTPGQNHTLLYYAVDNLDNNSGATAILSRTFRTGAITNGACGLVDLIPIILAAIIIISILFALKMGVQIDGNIVAVLVVAAIIGVIAIVIYSTIAVAFCPI
jgi:hypothetical protein